MRYSVILSDPPWSYNSRCTWSDTRFGGGVHRHYPTMSTEDICALPVGRDYAAPNCALFLWTTGPHLKSGIQVVEALGFECKTIAFVWVKTTRPGRRKSNKQLKNAVRGHILIRFPKPFFGTGYYTKSNAEICLLGVSGRMEPVVNTVSQVVLAPHPTDEAGKIIHSRKPVEVHRRIERLFGDRPRLEVFARVPEPGWDVVGNQLADGAVELRPQRTLFNWHNEPIVIGG